MQSSSKPAPAPLPPAADAAVKGKRREDLVYQAVTIAAILLVLGSLWVF